MNVFEYAMKMEVDGKAYYLKLADQTGQEGLKTIFRRLAEDEQKHYEIFRDLRKGAMASVMQDTTILEDAKNVFEILPRGKTALKGVEEDLSAYRHAMKLEADSFRLYEEAASKEGNTETKNLLLRIAEEEHKHFNILENIYHFVNAPNEYLAWGEFSNLDEFRNFGRDVDE